MGCIVEIFTCMIALSVALLAFSNILAYSTVELLVFLCK